MVEYFGIRHLSANGSWHLLQMLDKINPDIVLIEAPSDLSHLIDDICLSNVMPPIAIMAYSQTIPIQTILYPLAEYSPEYQAMLWAKKNQKECRFIDLPSNIFLALGNKNYSNVNTNENKVNIYEKLDNLFGEEHDSYWERYFEHNQNYGFYKEAAYQYGLQLRQISQDNDVEKAENIIREAYMKFNIEQAIKDNFSEDKIFVVTGAYHVEGLKSCSAMTEDEFNKLPQVLSKSTLMPYSYYRLSTQSGYGAGNKAPAYYEILWKNLCKNDIDNTAYHYLSGIAERQRKEGNITSSAEVIEAVRLSKTLASLKGNSIPTISDLRDAAKTCMGHGNFSEISIAVASVEIGSKIGSLPQGISRTSIQDDFYKLLKELKLEKYKSLVAQEIELDLRENIRVKSEKSAFLDLNRSFFLHKLELLKINFVKQEKRMQDNATWAEKFILQWSPECEIQIVEATLKGDTIELAAGFVFKELLDNSNSITDTAEIINKACLCGMSQIVNYAVKVIQAIAIDTVSFKEIGETINTLSYIIRYGSIRKFDANSLIPILEQLYLRGSLILTDSCKCDNNAVENIIKSIDYINYAVINHDFLDEQMWINSLSELSDRDDLNTKASGFAAAILIERGKMSNELLSVEVQRRLSKGVPADLGAAWFEGLASKNKYSLISRLSLWKQLSEYIEELDDDEFKRAVVFLRRCFCKFNAQEKNEIGENLGEIWGLNGVSEVINDNLTNEENTVIEELEEFDFGDLL